MLYTSHTEKLQEVVILPMNVPADSNWCFNSQYGRFVAQNFSCCIDDSLGDVNINTPLIEEMGLQLWQTVLKRFQITLRGCLAPGQA